MNLVSTKGMLQASKAEGVNFRMTKEQVGMVFHAVQTIMDHMHNGLHEKTLVMMSPILSVIRSTVLEQIADYPKDHSCATCDYEVTGHCLHFKQDIPSTHFEDGCDNHKAEGTPF